jgi:hypothetical protein
MDIIFPFFISQRYLDSPEWRVSIGKQCINYSQYDISATPPTEFAQQADPALWWVIFLRHFSGMTPKALTRALGHEK